MFPFKSDRGERHGGETCCLQVDISHNLDPRMILHQRNQEKKCVSEYGIQVYQHLYLWQPWQHQFVWMYQNHVWHGTTPTTFAPVHGRHVKLTPGITRPSLLSLHFLRVSILQPDQRCHRVPTRHQLCCIDGTEMTDNHWCLDAKFWCVSVGSTVASCWEGGSKTWNLATNLLTTPLPLGPSQRLRIPLLKASCCNFGFSGGS